MSRVSRRAGRRRKRRANGAGSASRAFSKSPAASRARARPSPFPATASCCWRSACRRAGRGTARSIAGSWPSELGIPAEQIEVAHGDSDDGVPSAGAVASRSTMSVGGAVAAAIDAVIEKGQAPRGACARSRRSRHPIPRRCVRDHRHRPADRAVRAGRTAPSSSGDPEPRYAAQRSTPPPTFPNGVHVAEVEIDPDTGRTTLAAYTAVDDCGRVLQPVLVEGQVQGGVAQGVGQALLERGHYDDASGQLLAGSFMDYAMPRADDLPDIVSVLRPVPLHDQPARRQGRRRGRHDRLARRGDERGRRCRRQYRHARHPRARVAGADRTWRRNLSSVIPGQPKGLNPAKRWAMPVNRNVEHCIPVEPAYP